MFLQYEGDPFQLPPLTLAYIGDAVYELYVRKNLLVHGEIKAQNLHKKAVKRVNAATQAKLFENLEKILSERELAVAKRGRNAKSGQIPKNAEVLQYRKSTGLEALIGYLYLEGEFTRAEELLGRIEEIIETNGEN